MTRFFEPYYDLSAKGSDVFFKTLLGDIEGMVNIDVGITGRDTITIAGEIEAIDAVMYQEFEVNTLPTAEPVSYYTSPSPRDGLLSRMPSSA